MPPEKPEEKSPQWPNEDGTIPQAPEGFAFHRIGEGDSLLSLSLRYSVPQGRLRKFNKEACFGHQLGHMVGKLLLIPLDKKSNLSVEEVEKIEKAKETDELLKRTKIESGEEDIKEPTEDGKYNLRRAFQYHAPGVDDQRANYYLGEGHWNIRKSLEVYRQDCQWEKEKELCQLVPGLTTQQATEILSLCENNVSKAVKYCRSRPKEVEKKESLLVPQPQTIQTGQSDIALPTLPPETKSANGKDSSKSGCTKSLFCMAGSAD